MSDADHGDGDETKETAPTPYVEESKSLTAFEALCWRLRRDEVDTCSVPMDFDPNASYGDSFAFLLAGSLVGNKSLKEMDITLTPDMTEEGARALAKAVQSSAIEKLTIEMDQDFRQKPKPQGIQTFYMAAIGKVRELAILFRIGYTDAKRIGEALQGNRNLETLCIDVCEAADGACALSEGIQTSSVSSLVYFNTQFRSTRYLFINGVLNSSALRHLQASNAEGRDFHELQYRVMYYSPEALEEPWPWPVSQLESLALVYCNLTNYDMGLLVKAMGGNSNLKVWNVGGNLFDEQGIQYLLDSWRDDNAPMLQELGFHHNEFGVCGLHMILRALASYPSLKFLHLGGNKKVGEQWVWNVKEELIADGRNHSIQLDYLDLSGCGLDESHMDVLARGVFENSTIKKLHLNDNRLFYGGVEAILGGLDGHGLHVEEINLQDCQLELSGMCELLKQSSKHSCWKTLHLDGNSDLGYRGLAMFAEELAKSKLVRCITPYFDDDEELYDNEEHNGAVAVDDNDPTAAAIKQLEECDTACRALVQAVKTNTYLEDLSLRQLEIPDGVKEEVEFYLQLNKFGRRHLQTDQYEIETALWGLVVAKCSNNSSSMFYLLKEYPTLVRLSATVAGRKRCSTFNPASKDNGKRHMAATGEEQNKE